MLVASCLPFALRFKLINSSESVQAVRHYTVEGGADLSWRGTPRALRVRESQNPSSKPHKTPRPLIGRLASTAVALEEMVVHGRKVLSVPHLSGSSELE